MLNSNEKTELSLLMVDDESKNIQLLGNVLEKEGYRVEFAMSGEECLEWVNSKHFDLILLDIMMPGIDGFEVCERLKAAAYSREIPVIFLTAKTDPESVVRGFQLGGVDYITKPFNKDELLIRVETHLELNLNRMRFQQAYQELQETQAQLVSSAKLAAVGKLAGGVAHEINNPLMVMQMQAHFLKETIADGQVPEISEVETILSMIKKCTQITRHLLAFGRNIKFDKNSPTDINTVVENALLLREQQIQADNIQLKKEFSDNLPKIFVAPIEIEQVMINLLDNSREALLEADNKEISIKTYQADQSIFIKIQDSGAGIPDTIIDRIFEPFFTTQTVGEGKGLGLSVSYGIIKEHGGSIHAKSEEGCGAIFTIELPHHT